jgi:hypothetical protein
MKSGDHSNIARSGIGAGRICFRSNSRQPSLTARMNALTASLSWASFPASQSAAQRAPLIAVMNTAWRRSQASMSLIDRIPAARKRATMSGADASTRRLLRDFELSRRDDHVRDVWRRGPRTSPLRWASGIAEQQRTSSATVIPFRGLANELSMTARNYGKDIPELWEGQDETTTMTLRN